MENFWIEFTKQTKIEYNKIKDENEQLKNFFRKCKGTKQILLIDFNDEYFSKIVNHLNEYKTFKIKKINLDSSRINKGLSNM